MVLYITAGDWGAAGNEKRERERDFYLTPARPGCGHIVASDTVIQGVRL